MFHHYHLMEICFHFGCLGSDYAFDILMKFLYANEILDPQFDASCCGVTYGTFIFGCVPKKGTRLITTLDK